MKKVIGILTLLVFILSCRKEKSDATTCIDGYIYWGGDYAVDGSGWNLKTGGGESTIFYALKDLPDEFKTDGLAVTACIEQTKEKVPCFCAAYYSKIISIKKR